MDEVASPLDVRIRELVDELGRRIVTATELRKVGASKKAVFVRRRNGRLRRIHDDVYLIGTGELTWREEILAGVLAGGDTARASHFSALRIRRLGDYQRGAVHVTVAHGSSLSAEGVVCHRTRRTVPSSVIDGIPVVCVEESLLNVAPKLSTRELHRLVTEAWRRRLTTPRKIVLHLERYGAGIKGRSKLLGVAQLYVGSPRGPGSNKEADFLFDFYAALDANGIERPVLQFEVKVRNGTEVKTVDFAWPARVKLIEMKGLAAHGDYVIQDEDVEREGDIRAAGWELDSLTPRAMRERPARTIARLIDFLQTPNAHWPDPT